MLWFTCSDYTDIFNWWLTNSQRKSYIHLPQENKSRRLAIKELTKN